jgi:peptidoglycan/LPS O-acetylase OafA/YrhL
VAGSVVDGSRGFQLCCGMTRERFELLDVMRGIAALAVMVGHVSGLLGAPFSTESTGLAVDFFFCLSGFVVAHAYEERLRSGALSYRRFICKRLIRLYPMLLAGVALGCAASLYISHAAPWTDAGLSLLLLPRLNGYLFYPLDVPMWSLLFELAASLAFGLIAKLRPSLILWALPVCGLALGVCVVISGQINTFGLGGGVIGLAKGALRIAYPFLLGVALNRFRRDLPRLPSLIAPLALVTVLAFAPSWTALYHAFAVLLALPLVVSAGVNGSANPRWLFLERLSYPLYLIHWPVLLVACHALEGRTPAQPPAHSLGSCCWPMTNRRDVGSHAGSTAAQRQQWSRRWLPRTASSAPSR